MAQLLRIMMEDREAAHTERQANLATLQHRIETFKTPTLQPSPSPLSL
jgi:hypothetical protein